MEHSEQIRAFVAQNFLFTDDVSAVDPAASLIGSGVIDSTGILELVAFLEETFGVEVLDDELVPDNLDSIERLATYTQRKLAEG